MAAATTEQATTERAVTGRTTAERAAVERATTEHAVTGQATTEHAAAERAVTGRATAERAAVERASAERAVAGRATTERAAVERASAERAVAGRASAEHAAARARAHHLGPERRRPLILDVAFELFLEHGYRGTSMDTIARAAGVTKPVVYACFSSKAELFGALLGREEQRMLSDFSSAMADSAGLGDPETALSAGFTAMLRAVSDTPDVYRIALLGGGDATTAIDARVRHGREQRIEAITAVTREWLQGRIPAGRLPTTAQLIGQTLVALGEAGMRTLLTSPEWTPESLGRALGRFAVGGCSALLEG